MQTEVGDQRKKAYDIKPQITVPDMFMELKEDAESVWYTFSPHEVKEVLGFEISRVFDKEFEFVYGKCVEAYKQGKLKVVKEYKVKELWKKVLKVQFETGMPYIAFIDEINRHNPNKHEGFIPCTNLCTESYSIVNDDYYHTCNLASIVFGRVEIDEIEEVAAIATRILDNGIELTKSPIEKSNAHNKRYRTVGVGCQGLHDIIAREGKTFYDEEFITGLAERMEMGCVRESIKLAQERGAYPAFKGSDWDNGNRIENFKKWSNRKEEWEELQQEIDKYGIRNSQLTSPAPNTSTSIFMDAGAGVSPVYSAFFYEDNKDGVMPVVAMHLKKAAASYFQDVSKHKPWELVKSVAWMQRFVDTGISAEYIMNKNMPDFNAKYLWDTLNEAWKNKTKAVYYIRTIKKGTSLIKEAEVCAGCAG